MPEEQQNAVPELQESDKRKIKLQDGSVFNIPSNFASPAISAVNSPGDLSTPILASPAVDPAEENPVGQATLVSYDTILPNSVGGTPQPFEKTEGVAQAKPVTSITTSTVVPGKTDMSSSQVPTTTKNPQDNKLEKQNPEDLTDAVAAAGVNIRAEEEALVGGITISKKPIEGSNFLKPHQLKWFMKKVMEENGLKYLDVDADVLTTISSAAETYMSSILTDTLTFSKHRRRPIQPKHKPAGGLNASRSAISRSLKEIATKQKDREEKRLKRRIALGIDTEDKEKGGLTTEEHRARNATAEMMVSGSKKSKYSWMMSGDSRSGSNKPNAIQARGDSGIRYREAREENEIAMRDLLNAVENRRIGASNVLVKGYSKLKD